MATAAPSNNLPLFYAGLEPLNSNVHANARVRPLEGLPQLAEAHAVPVTIEEFALAQRFYPIIFSVGDEPIPLALFGLNEGSNTFFDEQGKLLEANTYVPAYLRRYPFMLARLSPESDELSLCFDPSSGAVGEEVEGQPLFADGQPSETTQQLLSFCEQFEAAGQRTQLFMAELKKAGLLMDGEVAIQAEGVEQPFVYRGFQMVDEDKLRNLRGDELRKMNQSGMLALIFAHLLSLSQIREIFARQVQQGKGPIPAREPPA